MKKIQLLEKIESLEIQLRHLRNDYLLTKEEHENSTKKYLGILFEFKKKNKELEDLKSDLEKNVEERTKDLNDSKRKLQVKSEELQVMLDASPAMIFIKDRHSKIIRANKSFADIIGKDVKSIIGKTEGELFSVVTSHMNKDNSCVSLLSQTKLNVIEHLKTSVGERWVIIDQFPYRDIDGTVIGTIGFALDITERKHLEEQLVQSEKLASIGELVAGVAHELNNPLSIISGFSEMIKSAQYLKKKERERIVKISGATQRCSAIVDNLLRFSRKSKMKKVKAQINTVINDALSMMKSQLMLDNINVEKQFSQLPLTMGDINQLQSVFLNFIKNAHDAMYSSNKKGTLLIKTHHDNDCIIIEFIDDGPGIPKENQNKIYDPFYTTKGVGKGTGLGLSLCYGVIKEHDGELYYDDTYCEGAKFIVKIPIVKPEENEYVNTENEPIPYNTRILIIDDEADIVDVQASVLEERSVTVDTAYDAEQALELLGKNNYNYDIVICDMRMPGCIDGKDLFMKIKRDNEELSKRFIMSTGDISDETQSFLEENNLLFLKKPFRIADLLDVVKKGIKKNK